MASLFKIGDSFSVPFRFLDADTKEGISLIANQVNISASIANDLGKIIAKCSVFVCPDQEADAGKFILEVSHVITRGWKEGNAQMDIKVTMGDTVRHSGSIKFKIVKSITP